MLLKIKTNVHLLIGHEWFLFPICISTTRDVIDPFFTKGHFYHTTFLCTLFIPVCIKLHFISLYFKQLNIYGD